MVMLALVFIAACAPTSVGPPSPLIPPSAAPTATTAAPSPPLAPIPAATTLLTPVGSTIGTQSGVTVPPGARLIALAFDDLTRVWLVDPSKQAPPLNVAAWRAPRTGYANETLLVTPDARSSVIGAWGPSGKAALYAYDVPSGRTTLLYEDPVIDEPSALSPAMSADGRRYAFQTVDDVRAGNTSGGPTARLTAHLEPHNVFGVWHPVAWSADGGLLAISRSSEGDSEMALVAGSGGPIRVLGKGTNAAWRPDRPLLAVAAGVGAFGGHGLMYTYDAASAVKTDLETPSTWTIGPLRWDTGSDKLAFVVGTNLGAPREVWTRSPTGPATKEIGPARNVLDVWWSPVGSSLYAIVPREDANAQFSIANIEVIFAVGPAGPPIATLCRGDPRAACP